VTPDGALTVVDYVRYETVKASPEEAKRAFAEDKLHQWMRSINVEIPTMALLNNYDGAVWRIDEMAQMLANPTSRANLTRDTVQFAIESKQAGIVVDSRKSPRRASRIFGVLSRELGPALACCGAENHDRTAGARRRVDYKFFGKQCDAIMLMNYDQHWLTSRSGPIAAQDWFVENLRQVLEVVPASKLVVALRIMRMTGRRRRRSAGSLQSRRQEFSVQEALLHAYESEADVEFD